MYAKIKPYVLVLVLSALIMSACSALDTQANINETGAKSPQQQTVQDPPRTLSVNGTGVATLPPDLAYITIGIRTENADAREAVDINNRQTQELIDALVAFGVSEDDIRTTNFNIYSFEDFGEPFDERPPLVYSVENSVYVTVRDLDRLGDLLSTAVESGANNIWGIQFDASDRSAALSQAREAAVESAKAQAEELAALAGLELGEIVSISSISGRPVPFERGIGGGGGAAVEALDAVPVTPGLLTITTDVSLVYEIP